MDSKLPSLKRRASSPDSLETPSKKLKPQTPAGITTKVYSNDENEDRSAVAVLAASPNPKAEPKEAAIGELEDEPEERTEEDFEVLLYWAHWRLNFGRHAGHTLAEVAKKDHEYFHDFLIGKNIGRYKPNLDEALKYYHGAEETDDIVTPPFKPLISTRSLPDITSAPDRFWRGIRNGQKVYYCITKADAKRFFRLTDEFLGKLQEAPEDYHRDTRKQKYFVYHVWDLTRAHTSVKFANDFWCAYHGLNGNSW